ncbi:MAG: zinc ribbon domain-containing protein [Planctomycetota bacterium]
MHPPEAPDPTTNPCPACTTPNPDHARFCAHCGASLAPFAKDSQHPADAESRAERIRIRQEFNRARNSILFLRATFLVGALLFAVILAGTALADGERLEAKPYVLVGTTIGLLLMITGTLRVKRQPLVWAVVLACIWSLWATFIVAVAVIARVVPGPMDFVQIGLAASFWAGVVQASRAQQLMREHEELSVDRRKVGRRTKVEGGVTSRALARGREQRGRTWMRALQLIGLIVVVGVGAVIAYRTLTAPPSLTRHAEDLERLWTADLGGFLDSVRDMAQRGRLAESIERRGWKSTRPALSQRRIDDTTASVAYDLPATAASEEGRFIAHYVLDPHAHDWYLTFVELPQIRAGMPAKADQAFRDAWAARGTEELIKLLDTGLQRRQQSFRTLFERHDWIEERPSIRSADIGRVRENGTVEIDYEIAGGLLETRWEYWHPGWRMTRFAPTTR